MFASSHTTLGHHTMMKSLKRKHTWQDLVVVAFVGLPTSSPAVAHCNAAMDGARADVEPRPSTPASRNHIVIDLDDEDEGEISTDASGGGSGESRCSRGGICVTTSRPATDGRIDDGSGSLVTGPSREAPARAPIAPVPRPAESPRPQQGDADAAAGPRPPDGSDGDSDNDRPSSSSSSSSMNSGSTSRSCDGCMFSFYCPQCGRDIRVLEPGVLPSFSLPPSPPWPPPRTKRHQTLTARRRKRRRR